MALDRLAQADAFRASAADLAQKLGTILGDWTDITRKPVAQQRQLLRKLVPDRLTVTPHVDAKRKWIDWAGDLAVAPIISGIAPAVGDTMPEPMDQRWWPQRDSNPCFVAVTCSPAVSHTSQRQALFNDDATKTFNVRDGWETVVLLVQI